MTLQAGVELTDEQVAALPADRQPRPLEPFRINHPAPAPGQGLKRRSVRNDRWCPFCQTLLPPRIQACMPCKRARADFNDSHPDRGRQPDTTPQATDYDLNFLIDAVDEMSRIVALASAYQRLRGPLAQHQIEDMFGACKTVIVAAEPIRTQLRDGTR